AADVGEARPRVGARGGADRDGFLGPGGRAVAGVGAVVVTRGQRVRHTRGDGAAHRVVHGGGRAAAEAHVRHGRSGGVLGDPVDAGDHAVVGTGALAVEHSDGDQFDALGHTVGAAADGARHVRAVPVAVVGVAVVVDEVVSVPRTSLEVLVRDPDTRVDDVGLHVGGCGVVAVGVVQRQVTLVDPVQTPRRRVGLFRRRVEHAVLLHVGHTRIGRRAFGHGLAHRGRETVERVFVDVFHIGTVPVGDVGDRRPVLEHDDVAVVDGVFGVRTDDDALLSGRGEIAPQ